MEEDETLEETTTGIVNESILTSIKKLIGITEDDTSFDADLILDINSVFSILAQIGVGPIEGFSIQDKTATWDDFLDCDNSRLEMYKSYVHLRTRLLFDPPLSSAVIDTMNRMISELEWRMTVAVDFNNKILNSEG